MDLHELMRRQEIKDNAELLRLLEECMHEAQELDDMHRHERARAENAERERDEALRKYEEQRAGREACENFLKVKDKHIAALQSALSVYVNESILGCAELGFSCGSCGNENCATLANQRLLKGGA